MSKGNFAISFRLFTEIVGVPPGPLFVQELERLQVTGSQVDNVDVVANARPVLGIILVAEHG